MEAEIPWKDYIPFIQFFFYFGEGFSLTTILLVVPLFLTRGLGMSETEAGGIVSLAGLPWFLKFFFAAITDKVRLFGKGRRRPYLFLCSVLGGALWVLLSQFTEFNGTYLIVLVVVSSIAAFSDATLDGFVVDITPKEHQQVMQSAAWGGRAMGQILAAALALPIALNQADFQTPLLLAAIVYFITTFSSLALREPKYQGIQLDLRRGLKIAFEAPSVKYVLLLGFAIGSSQVMFSFASVILDNLDISDDAIKSYTLVYYVGNVIGALVMALFKDKEPKLVLNVLMLSAFFWSLLFIFLKGNIFYTIFFFVLGFLLTGSVAVYSKLTMEYSPTEVAATMFAIFASVSNLGLIVIGPLYTGFLLDNFAVPIVLFLASIWFLIAIGLTKLVKQEID